MISNEIKLFLEEQEGEYALYDKEARLLYATSDEPVVKEKVVLTFLQSGKEKKNMKECFFTYVGSMEEGILLVTKHEKEAQLLGQSSALAISYIMKAQDPDATMEGVVRKLITTEPEDKLLQKAHKFGLRSEGVRTVILFSFDNGISEECGEILRNLSPDGDKDMVITLDNKTLAYVRAGRGAKEEKDLESFAKDALAMLNAELLLDARAFYGNSAATLRELHRSYEEAYMAKEVAGIFYEEKRVASYNRLGIGRLIYELPKELCELFLKEIFGENKLCKLEEEEQSLIERFFANNLNISETARDLFMHRNTLTFRLEKLQKHTGLDIRKFDDAMTLKLGMMVARFMQRKEIE